MSTPHPGADRNAVLRFIADQQLAPSSACAYVGTLDDDLEQDLDELDQPWMQTLRVCTAPDGDVTGAAVIEWDAETDRSWVHGPWTTADTWDIDALPLLQAVIAQAPVQRHEMYAAVENQRLAHLARSAGWRVGEANFEYRRHPAQPHEAVCDPPVRPAAATQDVESVASLHDAEFPDTYATARQLLDPAGPYTVLIVEHAGRVAGYIAGQESEGDTYIDFLAVHDSSRRLGP